jgi:hypothetical protein
MVPGAVSPGNATADMTVRRLAAAVGRIGPEGQRQIRELLAPRDGIPAGRPGPDRSDPVPSLDELENRAQRPAAGPGDPVAGAVFRHGRHGTHPS